MGKNLMIKAILFDFDGVLVNSLPFYVKAYYKALKKFNIKLSEKEIVANCFSKQEAVICQNLGIKNVDLFAKTYFDSIKKNFKNVKLFPGTLEFINFVTNRKIKIAILTFAYKWYIDMMLKNLNLKSLFDLVVSSDDVKQSKPHPEMAFKACSTLKINPDQALVIGDSKSDILMGKAAGTKTCLFFPKNYNLFYNFSELKKTNPDYIVENFTQPRNLLLKL